MQVVRLLVPVLFAAVAIGAGELPPMPSDAPAQGEIVFDGMSDQVATGCADRSEKMNHRLGRRLVRVVVTKSATWGTIWRADTVVSLGKGVPDMLWRTVCWKSGQLERPLEMFDPKQSIPPLN